MVAAWASLPGHAPLPQQRAVCFHFPSLQQRADRHWCSSGELQVRSSQIPLLLGHSLRGLPGPCGHLTKERVCQVGLLFFPTGLGLSPLPEAHDGPLGIALCCHIRCCAFSLVLVSARMFSILRKPNFLASLNILRLRCWLS